MLRVAVLRVAVLQYLRIGTWRWARLTLLPEPELEQPGEEDLPEPYPLQQGPQSRQDSRRSRQSGDARKVGRGASCRVEGRMGMCCDMLHGLWLPRPMQNPAGLVLRVAVLLQSRPGGGRTGRHAVPPGRR